MSYKDFSYPDVAIQFGLTEGSADLFGGVQDVPASAALRSFLGMNLTLANLINTEKARSELLVAPVLSELWGRGGGRINLFSGVEFPADPAAQLTGYVDFLIGQGPQLPRVSAPVVVIFEAKRDNIAEGYGQCIAAMIGAQRFKQRAGNAVGTIYGCVTTGINWKFLRLVGAFQQFMAPHPRPPFEDLVAFAVDGWIPESMHFLMGPELGHHHQAMQNFWKSWDEGEDGYLALLGRPMRREEKYWLIQHWLRRVAIGRDQFYVGKQLAKEEWLVSPESYFDRKWCDGCWGRLRVFSDGSADAWIPGTGLLGYENEEYARRDLNQSKFFRLEEVRERPYSGRLPEPPPPPVSEAEDPRQPFLYEGQS